MSEEYLLPEYTCYGKVRKTIPSHASKKLKKKRSRLEESQLTQPDLKKLKIVGQIKDKTKTTRAKSPMIASSLFTWDFASVKIGSN